MRKLLASASLLVLSSASAMAADLPMKAAPYMAPAPLFMLGPAAPPVSTLAAA